MSFYFRQKQMRPQTTSLNRQIDNSSVKESKLIKQFTTPKMGREQENLYDENIKLKASLNEIAQQLIQSRARVQQLEKELQRFENLLDDSIKSDGQNHKQQVERHGLVLRMKARQKQLIIELQKKTKELDDLKKTMRYTNYQELEIELKSYIEESIRLRAQLDYNTQMIAIQSSGESLEKKILHLEKTVRILSKDNQELSSKQQQNDSIVNKLQVQLEESNKSSEKYLNDVIKYEKMIKELNEYNKQCNDVIQQLQFQNKIQLQNQQQNSMSEELQKTQLLLDQNSNKYQQEMDTKSIEIRALKTEIQRLNLQMQDMEKIIENQEDKIRDLESSVFSPISKVGQIESPLQNGFKIMQIEMKPQIKKKLPKVQFSDITQICIRVKLNLVRYKIPFSEIENYFNGAEELSIHQVKNILHKYPFEIRDHAQIKLLSRYLIEDNSEDYIMYDQDRKNSTAIIKSVIKKIVGKYEILSDEEEKQILQQIQQKLVPSISETISMMIAKKKNLNPGTCDLSDLEQALKFHEIQFTQQEMERFNLIVFEVSNSSECVNYERLLTYFK